MTSVMPKLFTFIFKHMQRYKEQRNYFRLDISLTRIRRVTQATLYVKMRESL